MCKVQENDNLLNHINNVKALTDQLACLKVSVQEEDIVMTLPTSYEYLITILELMLMKELTIKYVMTHLIHEISKRKEKES